MLTFVVASVLALIALGFHHRREEEAAMTPHGRIHVATYKQCSG